MNLLVCRSDLSLLKAKYAQSKRAHQEAEATPQKRTSDDDDDTDRPRVGRGRGRRSRDSGVARPGLSSGKPVVRQHQAPANLAYNDNEDYRGLEPSGHKILDTVPFFEEPQGAASCHQPIPWDKMFRDKKGKHKKVKNTKVSFLLSKI